MTPLSSSELSAIRAGTQLPSLWAQQGSGGSCPVVGWRKGLNSNRADSQLPPFPSRLQSWKESHPGVRRPELQFLQKELCDLGHRLPCSGPCKAGVTPAPRVSRARDTWVQIPVFPLTSCVVSGQLSHACASVSPSVRGTRPIHSSQDLHED